MSEDIGQALRIAEVKQRYTGVLYSILSTFYMLKTFNNKIKGGKNYKEISHVHKGPFLGTGSLGIQVSS